MLTEDKFKEGYKEVEVALKSLEEARELFANRGEIFAELCPIHEIIEDVVRYKSDIEKFFVDYFLKNTNN